MKDLTDIDHVLSLIDEECEEIKKILIDKNTKYGNSIFDPVRVFSSSEPGEQIDVRLDDKFSRIIRGIDKDDEDPELDIIGYLILKRIWKKNGK